MRTYPFSAQSGAGDLGWSARSRSVRRLRQCPAANVLVGVMLRGAARREQGLELTALERRLTSELEALVGKELVAEFGRIYQEPASRTGAASLFPALVADRPLKEGIEAEEVLTGREEVVVVTGAPTEGTEFEIDQVYERRVKFVRFRCDRESNEAGSDEVYWASGAAGDSQAQIVMLTPEYGGIHTGTVRNFGPDAFWCKGAAGSSWAATSRSEKSTQAVAARTRRARCWRPSPAKSPNPASRPAPRGRRRSWGWWLPRHPWSGRHGELQVWTDSKTKPADRKARGSRCWNR
ncbi:hypothetical protein DMH18_17435 [Streptomyces sp. WAC 06783]|uniref:hypothetical protein n=1 Tax=Streptomyces sp. WAC 06783 TaxID=2203211 RepID=UPI000F739D72|nr:hypothetical protein [Streptomyces sp. WAC 06783]RSO09549.1 hypothetical protein DMH18_17435 [Streptomyces sp. WAC 06783]